MFATTPDQGRNLNNLNNTLYQLTVIKICVYMFNIRCLCLHNTGLFIMYSGITKIYYRKTAGHVFTKPVQIEGTAQIFFSQ